MSGESAQLSFAYNAGQGCYGASKERGHATAWLDADQQTQIMKDTGCAIGPTSVAMLVLAGGPLVEI
jgi:hypothetical protein